MKKLRKRFGQFFVSFNIAERLAAKQINRRWHG
jgi:hypothetical protein